MASFREGRRIYSSKSQFYKRAARKKFGAAWLTPSGKPSQRNPSLWGGNLTGCTDTDYFYFLCPACGQVLQWNITDLWEIPSSSKLKKSPCHHIEVEVWCQKCQMRGVIKLNSNFRQEGELPTAGRRICHPAFSLGEPEDDEGTDTAAEPWTPTLPQPVPL